MSVNNMPWLKRKSFDAGSDILHIHDSNNERVAVVLHEDDANAICALPELIVAARQVIERWDSPLWADLENTGVSIQKLKDALKSIEAPHE